MFNENRKDEQIQVVIRAFLQCRRYEKNIREPEEWEQSLPARMDYHLYLADLADQEGDIPLGDRHRATFFRLWRQWFHEVEEVVR